MPQPPIFPCGGTNQPPCPPQPATGTLFSVAEMQAHGQACYERGLRDARKSSGLQEPQKDDL